MCVLIDTCCLGKVLDRTNEEHPPFSPVLDRLKRRKAKLVYGGTKYKIELSRLGRILPLLAELSRNRQVVLADDSRVDEVEAELREAFSDPKFNDQHLIAIVIVSRCQVVCTLDSVATSYLKHAAIFRSYGVRRPKIYKSLRNKSLCVDKYML